LLDRWKAHTVSVPPKLNSLPLEYLYFIVYGYEAYNDIVLGAAEWDRRFGKGEFPELDRNEVFDGLISAC
jgi:hypothetical protein